MGFEATFLAEFSITVCTSEPLSFFAEVFQMLYQRIDAFIRPATLVGTIESAIFAHINGRYIHGNFFFSFEKFAFGIFASNEIRISVGTRFFLRLRFACDR